MLFKSKALLSAAAILGLAVPALADVTVNVDTDEVTHEVDSKIYGHFYEHIYHSANGGLWGNVVWNRSFEQSAFGAGDWKLTARTIRQESDSENVVTTFGDTRWSDFEMSLQAKKLDGKEGFLVPIRWGGDKDFHWVNLGGWNNTQHAIESANGGAKFVVGQVVPGRIESGKWYDVRIRVEGRRLQTWLDGNLIFDEMLPEDQTPTGQVGLGTWATKAEYRNIEVKDLDGKTLFSGLPPKPQNVALAAAWDVSDGSGEITSDNPLNDEVAAHLMPGENGIVVLRQTHMKFDTQDALSGSIWLRGEDSPTVTIRALDETGEVLAKHEITGIGKDWAEHDIELSFSYDTGDGSLQIMSDGEVFVDQVNLMPKSAKDNDGFRTDLYEALAGLQPTIIRWPGGCYAEQYRWEHGVGAQHERKKNLTAMWEDYDPNSLGTDEFMTLSRKLGSEPLMVINTGMHVTGTSNEEEWEPWLESALNWIEYCNGSTETKFGTMRADNGHPEPYNVVYWEIDNELWRSLQPSAEVYARAVNYFAPAMRKKAKELGTEIIVLAHGGNGLDRRYNQIVLDQSAENFDILSIHHYTDPREFETGVDDQERLYEDTRDQIQSSKNPEIELYVSEWNAQSTDWRTGLYAGGLLNVFERQGDYLTLAGPALLMREHTAGAWDNAFINFKQDAWFAAPNYVVMKLWREHFAPNFLAISGNQKDLNLVATKSEDGTTVFVKAVNPSATSHRVTVNLDGSFGAGKASMQIVAPGELDTRNTFNAPEAVAAEDADVSVDGKTLTFEMPAYSAGVVTVEAK